jgi:hypothetical protein
MSSFLCEKCGASNCDTPRGYVSGCCHYPPEHSRVVTLRFDEGGSRDCQGFYWRPHGAFYKSKKAMKSQTPVHPIEWSEDGFDETCSK